MTALVIVEGVVIGLLVVLVAGLLRSHADILRRLHALGDAGTTTNHGAGGIQISPRPSHRLPAAVTGPTPGGTTETVALTKTRGLVLLAFLSSGCTTCRPFWEAFSQNAPMPSPDVRPVVVTKGPHEESSSKIRNLAPTSIRTVMSSDAWDDFQIPVSPYFVLVDATDGTVVGEGAASTWEHVSQLLSQAMADAGHVHDAVGTRERSDRTAARLSQAGIEPGDESLFRNPHEEEH